MRIATHVLLFGQDKWIMRNIANAYPHVEKIYIAHSKKPWAYNSAARHQYSDNYNVDLLLDSEYGDKIHLIDGIWDTEEEQRNACANQAAKDGMDYLLIHDADEFYFHDQFKAALLGIEKNPDFDFYKIGWYCFWKSFNNILLDPEGNKITGYPEFAINLKRGVRFASKRRPTENAVFIIDTSIAVCYHGSYVLSDQELYQKINTWGHANDFDREGWYKEKWLAWTPEMRDLHLVSPPAWSCAAKFDGILPEVLKDLQ